MGLSTLSRAYTLRKGWRDRRGRHEEASKPCGHCLRAPSPELAFPEDGDREAGSAQRKNCPSVSLSVLLELVEPERPIGLRGRRVATPAVGMPKAAVNEDGPSARTVGEVRRAGEVAVSRAAAEAKRTKGGFGGQLRLRSTLPDLAKALRGGRIENESVRTDPASPLCLQRAARPMRSMCARTAARKPGAKRRELCRALV